MPGESYLAALDALYDAKIAVTVCRQETGAAIMALTDGRLTGRPGICFVTRGPGATNAAHGVHIAEHDSAPLVLFVGQVERSMRGRGAFQEMDYRAFFGSTAKWATEVEDPARLPEIVQRAFHTAMQGRPGPVVVALPEDVLTEAATVADAPRVEPAAIWPGQTQMAELQKLLWAAERPVVVFGGGGWNARAGAALTRFAERFDLPLIASFRRSSVVDNDHPNFAGELGLGVNPKLKARVEAADLVLLIGGRMAETPSQSYTLFGIPCAAPGAGPRPRRCRRDRPRLSSAPRHRRDPAGLLRRAGGPAAAQRDCAGAARRAPRARRSSPGPASRRPIPARCSSARSCWRCASSRPTPPSPTAPAISPSGRAASCASAASTSSSGPPRARWASACRRRSPPSAPIPQRIAIAFAGDGDFLMNGQEFATAVQYDLPVVVVVVDNGMYGTIRMHQEREYPGRVSATQLRNPDFAALARAYGGHGETVEETEQFAPAFARALASAKPSILHVKIDPEAIAPATTLTGIREAALRRRGGG